MKIQDRPALQQIFSTFIAESLKNVILAVNTFFHKIFDYPLLNTPKKVIEYVKHVQLENRKTKAFEEKCFHAAQNVFKRSKATQLHNQPRSLTKNGIELHQAGIERTLEPRFVRALASRRPSLY